MAWLIVAGVLVVLVLLVVSSLKVVTEYERAVFFRLGHLKGAKGPGLILVIPVIDRIVRVSLRTVALEIPVQELVTKDNVTVRVNGVTYYVMVRRPGPGGHDRAGLPVRHRPGEPGHPAHRAAPGGPRLAAARARDHRQPAAHPHRLGHRAVGRAK